MNSTSAGDTLAKGSPQLGATPLRSPFLYPLDRTFSATQHFDLATSSNAAYITLPVDDVPVDTEDELHPQSRLKALYHRNVGLLLIASAQLFFSLMNLCAKLLSLSTPPIHPLEIIFVRMFISYIAGIGYLHYKGVPDYLLGPKGVRLLLIVRGMVGFFGLFGIYFSLKYLDLSDATVLTFLSPILTGYFGRIFLKEPFLRTEIFAGVLSLLGVFLIARPDSLFGHHEERTDSDLYIPTNAERLTAVGVALVGVVGAAGAYTSIRAIGSRAHPLISVSIFSLYATIVSLLSLLVLKIPFVVPRKPEIVAYFIALGVSGFAAQFLLTSGLQRERAGRGVTMVYLQMVFAFCFERWIWGVVPDFWSLSGSGLIVGGVIWVAVAKSRIKASESRNVPDIERGEEQARKRMEGEEDEVGEEQILMHNYEVGEMEDERRIEPSVGGSGSSSPVMEAPQVSDDVQVEYEQIRHD